MPLYPSFVLTIDSTIEFDLDGEADFFAELPAVSGLILLEMKDATAQPYLAQTADIRRAAERLLRMPESESKRLNLRNVAARIRYRATASKFERAVVYYQNARALFRQDYRDRLKLRPPALLKVNLRNSYPRCYVTRRVRADEGFYLGPFPSRRAADAFNEGILDLLKIRRCQIKIRRDPSFPGCVYSEMKMCMAPCFAGCTHAEYEADVRALVAGLDTRGSALLDPLEREREVASEALDFERAAALHKRVEKIKAALRSLPDIAHRVDKLDAIILQRGMGEKTVIAFPLIAGILAEPILLNFADLSEPRSVEAVLRETLEAESSGDKLEKKKATHRATPPEAENDPAAAGVTATQQYEAAVESTNLREVYGLRSAPADLSEHLSLVARWFYSKPRQGEILFRETDWPYRRILRACARLLAPPASAEAEKTPESPNSQNSL
ncbi:MAG TPA: UvrB/UvrC motif-containing protein [Candidatus Acidoferrales bacterium]|nr:UvrB/UvrC motif-containing protein [Candidatus Acidoferrales bacterium]